MSLCRTSRKGAVIDNKSYTLVGIIRPGIVASPLSKWEPAYQVYHLILPGSGFIPAADNT